MPSAREMLRLIARDPVAQARFFILSMRLFLEHVLGTGPFDDHLRHNGRFEGPLFPDGFAASGLGGAYGMLAALHGPIEEQARLSIHPHILLWFVHAQSEQWLRSILRRETEEARSRLRKWQESVLAAVQSMQLDSAAVLPLLLADDTAEVPTPRNTPFTEEQRRECRMDGQPEEDVRDPTKRRVLVETEPAFVDHHIRRYRERLGEGETPRREHFLPQTGAQLCRLPTYRLLRPCTEDDLDTQEGRRREAAAWRTLYCEDYRQNIAVGQMHAHKDTCFKYVVDKTMRFAKHCRFHFCHFVKLWLRGDKEAAPAKRKQDREVTIARTGKDLVLPQKPDKHVSPDYHPIDPVSNEPVPLRPTRELGASVCVDPDHGKEGLAMPIRYNPMEGSSTGPAQVGLRGNVDYQSMLRTFDLGFKRSRGCRD